MPHDPLTLAYLAITLASSLLSGLVGVYVSTRYYGRLESRKAKFDTARRLFGYRHNITGDGFATAMNEVFIVFGDAPRVITAMAALYETLSTPGKVHAEDRLVTLLKEICRHLRIDHSAVNESFFIKTFGGPHKNI